MMCLPSIIKMLHQKKIVISYISYKVEDELEITYKKCTYAYLDHIAEIINASLCLFDRQIKY